MSDRSGKIFSAATRDARQMLESLGELEQPLIQTAKVIASCLTSGKKLLLCGNGGSAADAADFCTEFACRFAEDRRPYPAMNLAQGGSLLTATANDYGFDQVFARQVAAFGEPGDVLIAISTSGKSPNIRRALEEAKSRRLQTVALLGRDGGACRGIADVDLIVQAPSTARIQEGHKFLLDVLCEIAETDLPRS
jgi:phosphoheptose isomerase